MIYSIKRRNIIHSIIIPLPEFLIIILKHTEEYRHVKGRLSLCIRLCTILDLVHLGYISISNDTLYINNTTQVISSPLHTLFLNKILSSSNTKVSSLLQNMLSFSRVRDRLYSDMETKKIVKVERFFAKYKVLVSNQDIYDRVYDDMKMYIIYGTENNILYDMILVCLKYMNRLDSISKMYTNQEISKLYKKISEIEGYYKDGVGVLICMLCRDR